MNYSQQNPFCSPFVYENLYSLKPSVVFEIGARDLLYSKEILHRYPTITDLHSFECNPDCIEMCRKSLPIDKVHFHEFALFDKVGDVPFNSGIADYHYGSSSMFENTHMPANEIHVPATTIERFCESENISSVDVLFIDAEGAEFNILVGAGEVLDTVRAVVGEFHINPDDQYVGVKSLEFVRGWMAARGFEDIGFFDYCFHNSGPKAGQKIFGNNLFMRK